MRRHNPMRVPDSHLPQGLASASETSSKTEAILPIIQKVLSLLPLLRHHDIHWVDARHRRGRAQMGLCRRIQSHPKRSLDAPSASREERRWRTHHAPHRQRGGGRNRGSGCPPVCKPRCAWVWAQKFTDLPEISASTADTTFARRCTIKASWYHYERLSPRFNLLIAHVVHKLIEIRYPPPSRNTWRAPKMHQKMHRHSSMNLQTISLPSSGVSRAFCRSALLLGLINKPKRDLQ